MPRRRSRQTPQSIMTGLALLVLAAVLYVVFPDLFSQGAAVGPTEPAQLTPPTATVPPPATGTAQTGAADWYELFFTDPDLTAGLAQPSGGVPDEIAASIDAAQSTVDVAVYEFNWMPLAQALVRAERRGVRVRVVTDTDTLGEETILELMDAGIPVVGDGREPLMHDKFVVVDGATVWTGSMNFTRNDAYRNNNDVLRISSPELAQNYATEFEEMFQGAFGPGSPANTPRPRLAIQGVQVENYFSPDDGVAAQILSVLQAADESIYFMIFSFTRSDFSQALLERAEAGVDVRGVFETRQIAAGADQAWSALTTGGLAANVRQDGNRYNLHNKVFIIDRETVVTGSYNFSRNAEERNDENVLILHDPAIAAAYFAEWQKVWDQAATE